jgi:hypothetical protein
MNASPGLLAALTQVVQAGVARAGATVRRLSIAVSCGALAAVAGMAAVGFSLTAIWVVAIPRVGPAGAALLLAGILAILCLFLATLAWAMVRGGRRKPKFEAGAESSLQAAVQMFNEHKGAMLMAALVAGLGAGAGSNSGNRSAPRSP